MSDYKRFVSYLYEYISDKKMDNRGFVKVELRSGICRMQFSLKIFSLPEQSTVSVYGYVSLNNLLQGFLLGELNAGKSGVSGVLTFPARIAGTPYSVSDFNGLILTAQGDKVYGTQWDETPIQPSRFIVNRSFTSNRLENTDALPARSPESGTLRQDDSEMPDPGSTETASPVSAAAPEHGSARIPSDTPGSSSLPVSPAVPGNASGPGSSGPQQNVNAPRSSGVQQNVTAPWSSGMPENSPAPGSPETPNNISTPGSSETPENISAPGFSETPENISAPGPSDMPLNIPASGPSDMPLNISAPAASDSQGDPSGSRSSGIQGNPSGSRPSGTQGNPSGSRPSGTQVDLSGSRPSSPQGDPSGSRPSGPQVDPSGSRPSGPQEGLSDSGLLNPRENDSASESSGPSPTGENFTEGTPTTGDADVRMASAAAAAAKPDPWTVVLNSFRPIRPFADDEITECVHISIRDFNTLRGLGFPVGCNQFIHHGYQNYHHLLLGRLSTSQKPVFILGVPGVYTANEQFMAGMFGFSCFKPGRLPKEFSCCGKTGYWYRAL